MSDSVLPRSLMDKLRCSLCHLYLSVQPVSGKKGNYTCGRCRPTEKSNEFFEEIAENALFPCVFDNCQDVLCSTDVEEHERACSFRPIECPVEGCAAVIEVNGMSVRNHFNDSHREWFHRDRCKNVRSDIGAGSQSFVHCITHGTSIFLFIMNITPGTSSSYRFSLLALPDSESKQDQQSKLSYTVELTVKYSKRTHIIRETYDAIIMYDELMHCMSCLNENCTKKNHDVNKIFLPLQFNDVRHPNYDSISYKVIIHDSDTPEEVNCPICCEPYGSKNIYVCPSGHSLCHLCTSKMTTCPSCRCMLSSTRNYALEEIARAMEWSLTDTML